MYTVWFCSWKVRGVFKVEDQTRKKELGSGSIKSEPKKWPKKEWPWGEEHHHPCTEPFMVPVTDCHTHGSLHTDACFLNAVLLPCYQRLNWGKHPAPQSFLACSAVLQGPVGKLCGEESTTQNHDWHPLTGFVCYTLRRPQHHRRQKWRGTHPENTVKRIHNTESLALSRSRKEEDCGWDSLTMEHPYQDVQDWGLQYNPLCL